MKKKKTWLIFVIVAFVLIVLGVLLFFFWPKKSNKEIYTEAIKQSIGITSANKDIITDYQKMLENRILKLTFDGDFTVDGKNEKENVELYLGKKQMYGLFNIDTLEKKINLETLFKDEKLYFTVKDVLSKYYFIEKSALDITSSQDDLELDTEKLVELLDDTLYETIDNKDVVKDESEITINDKKYNADKYSYSFTGTYFYNVVDQFVGKVKKDKDLYSQLKKIVEASGEGTIDEYLNSLVEEAKDLKEVEKLFTYTIYLYKDEVVSTVVSLDIEELPVSLVVNDITVDGKVYKQAYVSAMGSRVIECVVNQTSETNLDVVLSAMQQEILKGNITKNGNDLTFKLNIGTDEETQMVIEGNFKYVNEFDATGTIKMESDGEKVEYNVKVEEAKEIPQVDVSDSAPYDEMTDLEKEAMSLIFENDLGIINE